MDIKSLQDLLQSGLPHATIEVDGDGYHFEARIISDEFEGKNLVQRQQMVYSVVNAEIASGELHALSFKTYTPTEWQTANNK